MASWEIKLTTFGIVSNYMNKKMFLLFFIGVIQICKSELGVAAPPIFSFNFLTHTRTEDPDVHDELTSDLEKTIAPTISGVLNKKTHIGPYATVFRINANKFSIFDTKEDGIHRIITNSRFRILRDELVAPNTLIHDLTKRQKNEKGQCVDSADNTGASFQRFVIIKDIQGTGFVAVSTVVDDYKSPCRVGIPAWLTSPDGKNWTYHGKFKGESENLNIFGSGMALIIMRDNLGLRYRYYTDSYVGELTALESYGDNHWTFVKNDLPTEPPKKKISPIWLPAYQAKDFITQIIPETFIKTGGGTFSSAVWSKDRYYMVVTPYPTSTAFLAESFDGNDWHPLYVIKDGFIGLKNINLFDNHGALMGLATEWRYTPDPAVNYTRQDKVLLDMSIKNILRRIKRYNKDKYCQISQEFNPSISINCTL